MTHPYRTAHREPDHPLGESISMHRYSKGGLVTSLFWSATLVVVPCVVIAKWSTSSASGPALVAISLFPAAFAVLGVFALRDALRDWGLVLNVRERGLVVARHGAANYYALTDVRVGIPVLKRKGGERVELSFADGSRLKVDTALEGYRQLLNLLRRGSPV